MRGIFNFQKFIEEDTLFKAKAHLAHQIRPRKISDGARMTIVNDVVFQIMFNNAKNKKYLCMFLSILFSIDFEDLMKNSVFYKNRIDKQNKKQKEQVADVMLLYKNTIFSIEMNGKDTLERNQEYIYRAIGFKNKVGDKEYSYYRFCQINMLNFKKDGHDDVFEVYYPEGKCGGLYGSQSFVTIFLLNLKDKYYNNGVKSLDNVERMIMCLVETSKKRAKELAEGNDLLMEYNEELERISEKDYPYRTLYDKKVEDLEASRLSGQEEGREEGLDEGYLLGINEGIKQAISLMFSNGVPEETIAKNMRMSTSEVRNFIVSDNELLKVEML